MKNIDFYVESFNMKYELFRTGCDSIENMGLWNKEQYGEMDVFYSNEIVSIIIRLIAIDGKISQKEVDYLNSTFDFDYTLAELVEVYNACKDDIGRSFDEGFENGITYMRKINSELADEYKTLLALICEIIVESDGVIAEAERAEITRLKNMISVK